MSHPWVCRIGNGQPEEMLLRTLWMLTVLSPLALLPACAGFDGPRQTDATSPTVSYSYDDDDDYRQIAERADRYCEDRYQKDAVLLDREVEDDGYEATFSCE